MLTWSQSIHKYEIGYCTSISLFYSFLCKIKRQGTQPCQISFSEWNLMMTTSATNHQQQQEEKTQKVWKRQHTENGTRPLKALLKPTVVYFCWELVSVSDSSALSVVCAHSCTAPVWITYSRKKTASLASWLRHPLRERQIQGSTSIPVFSMGTFSGQVIPLTSEWALQWLPCQASGVTGSALALVGAVSVHWLDEIASLIFSFDLSVAAFKIVWANLSLRYTSVSLGHSNYSRKGFCLCGAWTSGL